MERRYILQFVCYSPKIYSRADREFVLIARKLCAQGITPVFIYSDSLDSVPQIREDIESVGGIVELMPGSDKMAINKAICAFYKKYHPELVEVHFMHYVKVCTALYSYLHGIKHISHIRSLIADVNPHEYVHRKGIVKRFLLGVSYSFLGFLGKVICISQTIEKQFREWSYCYHQSAITIYGGININVPNLTKQQAREKLGLPQDKFIITNVSAIEKIKGIDLIIRAIAILKRRGIDVFFAHIGGLRSDSQVNKDYAETLRLLSKEEEVTDRVFWLGKRFDIQNILTAFDIYVHPSRSEGLGSALLEASVAELPLVGSNIGGIPEIVINDETGLLIENENVEQLADAIQRLVTDETLRSKLGNKAKERVCTLFDMDKQTNKLIDEYGI